MTIESIPRVQACDGPDFARRHLEPSCPVVLTGMIDDWPALESWSIDDFQTRFGERLVTVGVTEGGRLKVDPEQGIPQREMRFGDYLDRLRAGDPGCYLLSPVDERLPELLDEIHYPQVVQDASWRSVRMWMGAAGTVSALHHDLPENFLAQVIGRKRVLVIDRRHRSRVYRNGIFHGAPNFCRVDAENPDYSRHPKFEGVPLLSAELDAGDVLFIPRFWFHHVRSLSTSLSVNLWFANGGLALLARASQAYARLRNLRM